MGRIKFDKNRILALISAFVVGSSFLLSGINVAAAETYVIKDVNENGEISLDEVNSEQLLTYALVSCYGVTGSDVTGSITSSSAYTSALSEVAGNENTILVGTVADGRVTFGEWFSNLCKSIYEEITGYSSIQYKVLPACSVSDLIDKLDFYKSKGSLSDSKYTTIYNSLSTNDLSNSLVYMSSTYTSIYDVSSFSDAYFYISALRLYYARYVDGSLSTGQIYTDVFKYSTSDYSLNSNKDIAVSDSNLKLFYSFGSPNVIFKDLSVLTKYVGMTSSIYLKSDSECDCNSRNDFITTLNNYDWSAISGQLYTHVSDAVRDANAITATQIQQIIDAEMEDLSEFIVEEDNSESGDSSGDSSENSGLLQKIYDLLCEWLPFLENIGAGDSAITDKLEENAQQDKEQHDEMMNESGSESMDSLPNDSIGDMNDKEDELLQDTSDAESDLDFQIDTNSNSFIWGMIESFLNSNEKVFASFVGIMTLGIVALILNR